MFCCVPAAAESFSSQTPPIHSVGGGQAALDLNSAVKTVLATDQETHREEGVSVPPCSEGQTILIVDDDVNAGFLLSAYLKHAGYQVIAAVDGSEALNHIAEQAIDLVILDVMMPKLNGFEVLHLLRNRYSRTSLPVIVTTALDSREDIVGAFDLGANDYISKPIDCSVLLARVKTQLSMTQERSPSTSPDLLGGRYRLLKLLGQGGFSQTYLARDIHKPSQPECVVKKLHLLTETNSPESYPQLRMLQPAIQLFEQEAKILDQLGQHPRLPELYAYFREQDQFYLVEEYIPGELLRQGLAARCWDQGEVVEFLCDLLPILSFVHAHGVIHRDIKPENIICQEREGERYCFLIDFGAIKMMQPQEQGRVRTLFTGTPGYAPYEQYAGRPRFNSDLYALGMVAIECLTGSLPDPCPPPSLQHEPDSLDSLPLTPRFRQILTRLIHPDPHQRYQTAEEVLQDLLILAPPRFFQEG